jgi:hypothetical protein
MSRTWARRRRRRDPVHGQERRYAARLRLCCGTLSQESHRRACRRSEAMCGVKIAFETPAAAGRAAEKMLRKFGSPGRAYECPECGMWHLSTKVNS